MNQKTILPLIVFSQFCCTSLWFAGNGVMKDLALTHALNPLAVGHLTTAVQFGFISGTLLFAILRISDRYSPSKIFFICATLGAGFNIWIIGENNNLHSLLLIRFLTGFSLAGIYPVGMKIAADYYRKGLGKSLGFLVGALVLGTAFPHLLNVLSHNENLPWKTVIISTSALATLGGLLILFFVPPGPYRNVGKQTQFTFLNVFLNRKFRAAAFGYFGHMWELYAFWAFVPLILSTYNLIHPDSIFNISFLSFVIIGVGTAACILGGYVSQALGTKRIAAMALLVSGLCCIISPIMLLQDSHEILIFFLILWGFAVVGDSPLFSTLVAKYAPPESKGTALTIVNSIGFAITVVSIQLMTFLLNKTIILFLLPILAIGPALGLWSLYRK